MIGRDALLREFTLPFKIGPCFFILTSHMCGIAGIFRYAPTEPPITQQILKKMSDAIAHRGPDDEGHFVSPCGRIGFAFRRLAIIDLSPAGHQPMATADGSVHIIFNGEIYNHKKLRAELERHGYTYRSKSDTETLLYAYQHWGERFIERLEGMFAIALWDSSKEKLFLYRDRIGIKPLYYGERNGQLFFASEIKALLTHPAWRAEVDETALFHYLTFIHTPAPLTLYKGVRKLEAGHYLSIDKSGNAIDTEFWDAAIPPPSPDDERYRDEDSIARTILTLLTEAIDKRMMSDVPFGVFLSGGIDSSANVALMARLMDRPVETFSVAISGQEETNEFVWARKISSLFGTNHHEVIIDDAGFLDLLPSIVYHQDEPLADPVCFPLYHVSKLARDAGVIVVQVGEGSDEQFCGYQSYLRALTLQRLQRSMRWLPSPIKRAGYAALTPLLRARQIDTKDNVVANLLSGDPIFWSNAVAFHSAEKNALISPKLRAQAAQEDSYEFVRRRLAKLESIKRADDGEKLIYWELKNRLAELLLMRVDKITMATSIEARVPFLDHKLVEFTMNIPTSIKTKDGIPKYILKRALRGVLPDEIIDRKKIGFAGSGKNMMTPEIFAHCRHLLTTSRHDYFDRQYIARLLHDFETRRTNVTAKLWMLYNFELWWRYWIGGESLG